jgi:4-amino-4-deoxy-L-arabinose transferase-like glycosyltransferase
MPSAPAASPTRPLVLATHTRKTLWIVLALLLIVRLFAMVVVPLTDTTEARYGEIARKMAETNDWVTPQFDYGIPFWAKPPLSTWLSAISIKLFDVSEFSVRLPSLLLALAMMALTWQWIASRRNRDQALLTVTLLASTVLFFIAAGAVMTDASLAICTTLTMIAFWNALHAKGRHWGYLFFVGLGFGLLAKGPLVGVLTFLPIVPWVIIRGEWRRAWQQIPWFSGSLLMLAISVPWYLVAEHKTPGFIEYFIVGEHINRFLHSGWTGDKYGHAHAEPVGTIWLYWFYSAFPFSLIAIGWLTRLLINKSKGKELRAIFVDDDGWNLYLLLWIIMLLLFFTFAGNIIWPYVLPGLPAFACLAIELWRRQRALNPNLNTVWHARGFIAACAVILVACLAMSAMYLTGNAEIMKSSQRELVRIWQTQRQSDDSQLVYFDKSYQSAVFYSRAKVRTAESIAELSALLDNLVVAHFEDTTLLAEQAVLAPQ